VEGKGSTIEWKPWLLRVLVPLLCAGFAGPASAIFLMALDGLSTLRLAHPPLVFFMPFAGLLTYVIYHRLDSDLKKGNNLIIIQTLRPSKPISWWMAPAILITTLLAQVGGASVGREGTAVQMSAALNDLWTKVLQLKEKQRSELLICATSAGFASVFGTPWAGCIFSIEVLAQGKYRWQSFLPSLLAAYTAHGIASLFPIPHAEYSLHTAFASTPSSLFSLLLLGILFGLLAGFYVALGKHITTAWTHVPLPEYWRPVLVGSLLAFLFFTTEASVWAGLGLSEIKQAFVSQSGWMLPLGKLVFTALCLHSGFKGGEVTPLFFMGATAGSALSGVFALPLDLAAGLGFITVFAAAAKTPLACLAMGLELFGPTHWLPMLVVVVVACIFSGPNSIYASQEKSNRIPFFSFNRVWEKFFRRK
jgi:H+/Cl- antiporter ClcA